MVRRRHSNPSQAAGKRRRTDAGSSRYLVPGSFAVAFILLVILFRDFIFSDKMLFGSDTLQAGYFYRQFLVDYIRDNWSFPQWDPYLFGGMPYIDAFHGDIFYPGTAPGKILAIWFDNLYRVLGWNLFWHIFLSGLFMYSAAREFRLSRIAAVVSGFSYMFTGYLISLVAPGHDGKIFVTTLFPLAMLFLHRGFDRRPLFNFSILGLIIGSIILSPHLQMSYFTLWALALYTLYRLAFMIYEKRPLLETGVKGGLVAWAVVVGLGFSAIQFLPGYVYTSEYSPRADTKKGWEWSTSWSMHEEEVFSLLIPEFSGTSSSSAKTYYWGKNAFKDNSESVGVVPLFLALIGAIFSRRKDRWFFGGLGLFALSYALASTTPLYHLYFLIPKVASMRAAAMIMFLFCFCVAILAGMGVQRIIESVAGGDRFNSRFKFLLFGMPGLMFVLALVFSAAGEGMLRLWSSLFYSNATTIMVQQGVSKFDVALANLPAVQSGAWLSFFFVALASGLIWLYRERKAGVAILIGLALIIGIDGVRFNSRFIDTLDFNQQFRSDLTSRFLAERAGSDRVMDLRQPMRSLQALSLPLYDVSVPVGYHGNQLRWYDELLGNVTDPKTGQQRFDNPNILNRRLINLLGVRYLILPSGRSIPPDFLGPVPLQELRTVGQSRIVENKNALPRAFLADSVVALSPNESAVSEIISGDADLRKVVFLDSEPSIEIEPADDTGAVASDRADIIKYSPDSVVVETVSGGNRVLVLTDVWYDAWKVTIDGVLAECHKVNGALRGVVVPGGSHRVVFSYDSKRYKLGKTISGLAVIYILLVAGITVVQNRRKAMAKEDNDNE